MTTSQTDQDALREQVGAGSVDFLKGHIEAIPPR